MTAGAGRRSRLPVLSLLAANAISLSGSTLTVIALPWFVLQTTGSAGQAGLVGFAAAIPRVFAGIFGGAMVDRAEPKRMSVVADTSSGIAVGLIPLLYQMDSLPLWGLLSLVFLSNVLSIPGTNARRALVPELAALAQIRLERVNAAFESIQYLSRLLGAPLAGLLIALLHATNVLWLDAASFTISAVAVAALVPAPTSDPARSDGESYRHQLAAGFRFLLADRVLLWMALALMVSNPLSLPLGPVFLPVYAQRVLGSAPALGLMMAAIGAGGVLGSFAFGAGGHRLPRRTIWLLPFVVGPVQYWALVAHPPLPVVIMVQVLDGMVFAPFNVVLATVKQERVPLELRGRVFGLFSAVTLAAQPLGVALAGVTVDALGLNASLLVFAAALQVWGIALLVVPALRSMNCDDLRPAPA